MSQNQENENRAPDMAVYEITQFSHSIAKKVPGLRNVEGVEEWVDLYVRSTNAGKLDLSKEAIVQTQEGNTYTVSIEGSHFVSPTHEALQSGTWQAGDWMLTVSGISIEQLHEGDLLLQEVNARERPARKNKQMTD